jgi:hypothetical protein
MVGSEAGIMIPLVLLALTTGRRGDKWFNIPRKEYWLAPERRADTVRHIQVQMLWLAVIIQASMMVMWQAGIDSNLSTPPLIPGSFMLKIGIAVVVCIVWAVRYNRYFHARPEHS